LEEWILRAAQELGINVEDYGLPNKANQLHKVINTKIENLVRLLENRKRQSKMLKTLEGFVKSK
jgi:hypothetical protein